MNRVLARKWLVIVLLGLAAWLGGGFAHAETPEQILSRIEARADSNASDAAKLRDMLAPAPEPLPAAPTPAPSATYRQPSGYFVMQEVGGQNIADKKLASGKFTGLVIREHWATLNPASGKYNTTFIDAQLARCKRLGKQAILAIYTGSSAPRWIGGQKFGPEGKEAPVPWSPQMLAAHDAMVARIGQLYANNPTIVAIEIGGPTCPERSLEMHPSNNVQRQKGYSEGAVLQAWMRCGNAFAAAFPNVTLISDGGPFPGGKKAHVTVAFWDYMRGKYGQRFSASHCSLKAGTIKTGVPLHHQIVLDFAKRGGRVGFEMVGPSLGGTNGEKGPVDRFEGKFSTALSFAKAADAKWLKVYQADEAGCPLPFLAGVK